MLALQAVNKEYVGVATWHRAAVAFFQHSLHVWPQGRYWFGLVGGPQVIGFLLVPC